MLIPKLPFGFHFPELSPLPTFETTPAPELLFLGTIKGLLSFVINLSLLDTSLISVIILLINANPSIRRKAAPALSLLFLAFSLEISLVNIYALVGHFTVQFTMRAHLTPSIRSYAPGSPHQPISSL